MTLLPRIVSAMGLEPGPIATNKARRVLEVMREPTPAILAEFSALADMSSGTATYIWQAAIDAAIEE